MDQTTIHTESPSAVAAPPPSPALPPQWTDPYPDRAIPFWESLRQDILAHVPPDDRQRSAAQWTWTTVRILLRSPGFKVTLLYRFNHTISKHGGAAGSFFAGVVNWFVHHYYFCSISPRARLHGGLILPHPQGMIIGSRVVVGPRAWIFQNVTMGGAAGRDGEPTVGADCRIRTGALICGPCVIGDDVEICPNSLLQRNVPSGSMAIGVPANVYPKLAKPKA